MADDTFDFNDVGPSAGISVADELSITPSYFLNQYFPDSPLNLSQRITALRWQDRIGEDIRANMEGGTNLVDLTKGLSALTTEEGLPQYMQEIERQARRIMGGDNSDYAAFQRLCRSTRADVTEMIQSNAPSKLGKAYAKLIDAASSLKEKALDAAIDSAIDKKALSNAFSLATSEIDKALNLGEYTRARNDPDCDAMEVALSSAGNNCEDCEELAETDNGAGPGIWPMGQVPFLPNHPRCRCILLPVYRLAEGTDPDFTATEDYDGDFMQELPDD
jgi:hypothetical protein